MLIVARNAGPEVIVINCGTLVLFLVQGSLLFPGAVPLLLCG